MAKKPRRSATILRTQLKNLFLAGLVSAFAACSAAPPTAGEETGAVAISSATIRGQFAALDPGVVAQVNAMTWGQAYTWLEAHAGSEAVVVDGTLLSDPRSYLQQNRALFMILAGTFRNIGATLLRGDSIAAKSLALVGGSGSSWSDDKPQPMEWDFLASSECLELLQPYNLMGVTAKALAVAVGQAKCNDPSVPGAVLNTCTKNTMVPVAYSALYAGLSSSYQVMLTQDKKRAIPGSGRFTDKCFFPTDPSSITVPTDGISNQFGTLNTGYESDQESWHSASETLAE